MNRRTLTLTLGKRTTRTAWGLAAIASYYVGRQPEKVSEMATDLHYTQETIRRMGRAYLFYREVVGMWRDTSNLRAYPHPRVWREKLTYDHFAELGEYWRKNEVDPLELFADIHETYLNGVGAKAMRENLDSRENNARPEAWRMGVAEMATRAVELQKAAFAPEPVKRLAGLVQQLSVHALNGGISEYEEFTLELLGILQPKGKR